MKQSKVSNCMNNRKIKKTYSTIKLFLQNSNFKSNQSLFVNVTRCYLINVVYLWPGSYWRKNVVTVQANVYYCTVQARISSAVDAFRVLFDKMLPILKKTIIFIVI